MPLPLTVSCFSKIQIYFTFLVPAHPGSPGKRAIKRVCVCVCVCVCMCAVLTSTAWSDVDRPTSSVVLRAVVLYVAAQCELRQLQVPLDVDRFLNPREVDRVHRVANCVHTRARKHALQIS